VVVGGFVCFVGWVWGVVGGVFFLLWGGGVGVGGGGGGGGGVP